MDIPGFQTEKLIGEGGMATVYLARQESLGRRVALKILRRFDDPVQAGRFLTEGRILAGLNHHNIITIFDIGVFKDTLFIAMEYQESGSLEERIRAGLSPSVALGILEGIGSCLDFVHRKGIIHRDVKPANILFHQDGVPKLTDFGIAKQLDDDQELTLDGSAFGSPYYISPEQAESRVLDGRTDIYSLGIVFYEMLTGHKPFVGESHVHTIMAHLQEPIPALPENLTAYQPLLDRMTAKDPDERFDSAGELVGFVRAMRLYVDGAVTGSYRVPRKPAIPDTPAGDQHPPKARQFSRAWPHLLWGTVISGLLMGGVWIFRDQWGTLVGQGIASQSTIVLSRTPISKPAPISVSAPERNKSGSLASASPLETGESASGNGLQNTAPGLESVNAEQQAPQDGLQLSEESFDESSEQLGQVQALLVKALDGEAEAVDTPAEPSPAILEQGLTQQSPIVDVAENDSTDPEAGELGPVSTSPSKDVEQLAGDVLDPDVQELQPLSDAQQLALAQPREESALIEPDGIDAPPANPAADTARGTTEDAVEVALTEEAEAASPIEQWMQAAQQAVAEYRLTLPADHSALYYYRKVLEQDAEHSAAHKGIMVIGDRYAALSRNALKSGELDKADRYIKRGLRVQPGHARWDTLRKGLDSERKERLAARQAAEQARMRAAAPPPVAVPAPPPKKEAEVNEVQPSIYIWDE